MNNVAISVEEEKRERERMQEELIQDYLIQRNMTELARERVQSIYIDDTIISCMLCYLE